jgi:membrane protein YdbS with pleckstrin-like domain
MKRTPAFRHDGFELEPVHRYEETPQPISDAMKSVMTTIPVVLLLSTIIWVAVYYEFPDAPLKPPETALILFLVLVVTAAFQAVWKRRRGRQRKETHGTHK